MLSGHCGARFAPGNSAGTSFGGSNLSVRLLQTSPAWRHDWWWRTTVVTTTTNNKGRMIRTEVTGCRHTDFGS